LKIFKQVCDKQKEKKSSLVCKKDLVRKKISVK
jgi:hypothetical protein